MQELAGELHAGDELICRASALRVQQVPADLPPAPVHAGPPRGEGSSPARSRMPSPESAKPERFSLDGSTAAGFGASAMEMRWLERP